MIVNFKSIIKDNPTTIPAFDLGCVVGLFLLVEQYNQFYHLFAQSGGAPEYIDCISAGVYIPSKDSSGYDTKQSDAKASVILEPWGMRGTPSCLSFPGLLWHGVLAPDRIPSMGQLELKWMFQIEPVLNRTKQHTYAKLNCLK